MGVIENLNAKIASSEKSKVRRQSDLEEISMEYERTHAAAIITEKRGGHFDKVVTEWKSKADDVSAEVDASQKECRNFNSELFRLRAAHDEIVEQLDVVKRENKNLADEIKDLLDQLGDGGRSIHELDKQRRRLEVEKEELQAALEEAEAALEQEIDRRIQEKEEEFDNTRKNHQRELEVRLTDAEANAMKGGKNAMAKLEMRIRELEMELGSVQSRTGESYKAFQRAERRVKELQFQQEEDRKNQDRMGDLANKLQQKIKTYKQQIEEAEEIAALNLAKYRKGQQELEETEERAKMAGVQLEA